MVRLWEHPHLGEKLVTDMKMPTMLVQALRSWGGTQDVVTNLAGGEVSFLPQVAMRVRARSIPFLLLLGGPCSFWQICRRTEL